MDREAKKSGEAKKRSGEGLGESTAPTDSPRGNIMRLKPTSSRESMTYPTRFGSSEEFQLPRELTGNEWRTDEGRKCWKFVNME